MKPDLSNVFKSEGGIGVDQSPQIVMGSSIVGGQWVYSESAKKEMKPVESITIVKMMALINQHSAATTSAAGALFSLISAAVAAPDNKTGF